MNAPASSQILKVTPEDIDYFRQFKPLHYLTLQKMLAAGRAEIVKESAAV